MVRKKKEVEILYCDDCGDEVEIVEAETPKWRRCDICGAELCGNCRKEVKVIEEGRVVYHISYCSDHFEEGIKMIDSLIITRVRASWKNINRIQVEVSSVTLP